MQLAWVRHVRLMKIQKRHIQDTEVKFRLHIIKRDTGFILHLDPGLCKAQFECLKWFSSGSLLHHLV